MLKPVAQKLPVEPRWGVRRSTSAFSAAEWGDRASHEARWRLRGDCFHRDPFMQMADSWGLIGQAAFDGSLVRHLAARPPSRLFSRSVAPAGAPTWPGWPGVPGPPKPAVAGFGVESSLQLVMPPWELAGVRACGARVRTGVGRPKSAFPGRRVL